MFSFLLAHNVRGQGSWSEDSTNGFTPVGATCSCVLNGKIYVIGGSPYYQGYTNAVQIFDPLTHLWSQGTSLPLATIYLSCNALNGKIYALGGILDTSVSLASTTVEIFDTSTNTWSAGPPMPTARNSQTSNVVNGKIYVFGGYGNVNISDLPLTSVDVFDPSDSLWSSAPPMPSDRSYFTSCVVNGKIYLIGGMGDSDRTTVDIFDPASNAWSAGPPMPIGLSDCTSSAVNGKIYVTGGIGEYVDSKVLEIFDTSTNTWSIGPDVPTGRTDLTSSEVNGKIYALGGIIGSVESVNTNEVFTPGPLDAVIDSNSLTTLRVFPNPASGELQIIGEQLGEIHLFDLMGRERINAISNGTGATLDVSRLEAGMYFVRLGSESAKVTIAH